MKNFIRKIKFGYHFKRASKALEIGDREKFDKHSSKISELFWNTYNKESK